MQRTHYDTDEQVAAIDRAIEALRAGFRDAAGRITDADVAEEVRALEAARAARAALLGLRPGLN